MTYWLPNRVYANKCFIYIRFKKKKKKPGLLIVGLVGTEY